MSTKKTMKSAFESMMFVWGDPIDAKIAGGVFNITTKEAIEIFRELKKEYEEQERGILIREIDGSFQFVSNEENFDYIRTICTPVKTKRLSQAALEVLAIVSYKQPVTKSEIDSIRGIKSDRVLEGLVNKDLIEDVGRADTIGRPMLYGTTKTFLRYFDLENIKELPEFDDIEDDILFAHPEVNEAMQQLSIDNLTESQTDENTIDDVELDNENKVENKDE